ncbi:hypothetical protein NSK_005468 [Nannochloropsis salina CCMP1776]|uniref:THIF-type NAD/FAD binding fold domain-containing protein n=1 Tax=Nannochloropsis salina CCMP1776 TaxID=1027361 RepID=A0A4D9CZZ8_9STRA|nr:hypothetical protein NSK_005468 [Nannochloropsis salina CCMP1776]|eukprot:TFJ83223.1 hypothetical protein NSK_005468 [Nannochloropsis salina CCMP1776]
MGRPVSIAVDGKFEFGEASNFRHALTPHTAVQKTPRAMRCTPPGTQCCLQARCQGLGPGLVLVYALGMDTAENNQIHEDEAQTGPSKKDTKYDRQLRLWGVAGQKSLSEAHVLLVNAGPTGTELLKNLVLPGMGRFTILDEHLVTARDCRNNFFVSPAYLVMEEETGEGGPGRWREPLNVVSPKHAAEIARYGATELHNIAAIMGGIGAQEAVKILTQQYVPVDNTFLYNGIASMGGVYRL